MMKLRIHVVLLLLGWIGCMSLMYASDPIVRSFSVMERNHIRVKTPELFANGNSFEIHLENLSDSMWCFPLPKGKVYRHTVLVEDIVVRILKPVPTILSVVSSMVLCVWLNIMVDMAK